MREPVMCCLEGGVSDMFVVLQEVERECGMDGQGRKDRAPPALQGQRLEPGWPGQPACWRLAARLQSLRLGGCAWTDLQGGPLVPSTCGGEGGVCRVLGKAA